MKKNSVYSLHPGFAMEASYAAGLTERTGKNVEQWAALVRRQKLPTQAAMRAWLKEHHGFGMNYAHYVASYAAGEGGADSYDPDAFVDALFAGPKASLRPLYEELLAFGLKLGRDVKACPGKTIVPFYRRHVFSQLKPTTRTRLDLGLALGDLKAESRLIDTGGFAKKDRITHRLEISTPKDFDAEAKRWWKLAYTRDA